MSGSVYPEFFARVFYDTNRFADVLHVESVVAGMPHYSRIVIRDASDHGLVIEALGAALAELRRKAGESE